MKSTVFMSLSRFKRGCHFVSGPWKTGVGLLAVSLTPLLAQNTAVTGFGDGGFSTGWQSDDTRNAGGGNIINGTTHSPAAGANLDPTQVAAQIDWLNYAESRGNLGGVFLDGTGTGSGKSTLSLVDSSTGLAAASVLNNSGFLATYAWKNTDSVIPGPALKFGIQSTSYGGEVGQSQNAFAATRSGEAAWDLVLVFDPTNNDQNSPVPGQLYTSTVTADSKFALFPQASNAYWVTKYGAITTGPSATIGIAAGSKTLAEWAALDIDGAGTGTVTWGDVLFGAGAKIANTQLGFGSGNAEASGIVDWASVSFLNNGAIVNFVDASKWNNAAGGELTFGANWDGPVVSPSQNGVFDLADTYAATISANGTVRSLGVIKGNVTLQHVDGSTLTLADGGRLSVESGASLTQESSGEGVGEILGAGVDVFSGTFTTSSKLTLNGGNLDVNGTRPAMIISEGGTVNFASGADVSFLKNDGVRPLTSVGVVDPANPGSAGTAGVLNIAAGASVRTEGRIWVGNGGVGELNLNGGSLTLSVTDVVPSLIVGTSGGSGVLNQTAGSITFVNGASYGVYNVGSGGTGVVNHSGGTVDMGGSAFQIGVGGGTGTYHATDTARVDLGAGSTIYIGEGVGGNGLVEIGDSAQFYQGSLVTPGTQIFLGANGGTGKIHQTGEDSDVRIVTNNSVHVGYTFGGGATGAVGTYQLDAGSLTMGSVNANGVRIGESATASGNFIQNAGTSHFVLSNVYVGQEGTGVFTLNGGTSTVDKSLVLAQAATATGTLNLNGGTLEVGGNNGLGKGAGSATVNLGGGTVRVITADLTSSLNMNVVDNDPTAGISASVVDTNGRNATLTGNLAGAGALVKIGAGNLILGNAARSLAYFAAMQGVTQQTGGTTTLGSLFVGANSPLGGSNGALTLTSGTINVAAHNGAVSIGAGSGGNNTGALNIDGGVLNLGVAGSPGVRVDFYAGAFGSSGTGTVNQTGGVVNKISDLGVFHIGNQATGIYNLSGGAINIQGNGNGMVLGRSSVSSAGHGTLNVSSGTITFTGGTDLLLGGAQESEPENLGSGTVNQTGGTVSFRDNGHLVLGQRGAGTYNLNGGILEIGGANSIYKGSGAGAAAFNFGGGTLRVVDANLSTSVNATLREDTASTIDTNGRNATWSGSISGDGALTKAGSGTLVLSGNNTYSGGTRITGGIVEAAHNHAFGTGVVTVDGGVFLVDAGVTTSNDVILSGGAYNRALQAGANLADAVNATSHFSGGRADTTAQILQGTLTNGGVLQTSFSEASGAVNDGIRLSDVYSFHGTEMGADLFVLQLSMTGVTADSFLGWLNASNEWVNAVEGNSSGEGVFVGRAYNSATDFHLGYYGVDTASGSVWAVLDHNSLFAVVPEPSVATLLGLAGLAFLRRRRTRP